MKEKNQGGYLADGSGLSPDTRRHALERRRMEQRKIGAVRAPFLHTHRLLKVYVSLKISKMPVIVCSVEPIARSYVD